MRGEASSCTGRSGAHRTLKPDGLPAAFAAIGIDRDYSALDLADLDVDITGWGSDVPTFEAVLREVRPSVVVELGTWKGASVLHMRDITKRLGFRTRFVCVDTWLGSADHWITAKDRAALALEGGYPTLYRQFVRNVIARDAVDDIFPLPMSTSAGARVLEHLGLVADVVYVDAAHEEDAVRTDLDNYFPLLRPGGIMFGDDYHPHAPGVVRAVDAFARALTLPVEQDDLMKWIVRKPN